MPSCLNPFWISAWSISETKASLANSAPGGLDGTSSSWGDDGDDGSTDISTGLDLSDGRDYVYFVLLTIFENQDIQISAMNNSGQDSNLHFKVLTSIMQQA